MISRKDAKAAGLARYFTGQPCKRGHIAERITANGTCMICSGICRDLTMKVRRAEYYAHRGARDYKKHRLAIIERARAWERQNSERAKLRKAANYQARRGEIALKTKAYRSLHKAKYAAYYQAWRALKKMAMPCWADGGKILAVYEEAERLTVETGVSYEVDHIYPLHGKNSCGLHIHTNLRAIPKTDNRRKGNRLPDSGEAWGFIRREIEALPK